MNFSRTLGYIFVSSGPFNLTFCDLWYFSVFYVSREILKLFLNTYKPLLNQLDYWIMFTGMIKNNMKPLPQWLQVWRYVVEFSAFQKRGKKKKKKSKFTYIVEKQFYRRFIQKWVICVDYSSDFLERGQRIIVWQKKFWYQQNKNQGKCSLKGSVTFSEFKDNKIHHSGDNKIHHSGD